MLIGASVDQCVETYCWRVSTHNLANFSAVANNWTAHSPLGFVCLMEARKRGLLKPARGFQF